MRQTSLMAAWAIWAGHVKQQHIVHQKAFAFICESLSVSSAAAAHVDHTTFPRSRLCVAL